MPSYANDIHFLYPEFKDIVLDPAVMGIFVNLENQRMGSYHTGDDFDIPSEINTMARGFGVKEGIAIPKPHCLKQWIEDRGCEIYKLDIHRLKKDLYLEIGK